MSSSSNHHLPSDATIRNVLRSSHPPAVIDDDDDDVDQQQSQQRHHPPNTPAAAASVTTTPDDAEEDQQLSIDLALFLSHPSLRAALADGSLDLKSYSATVQTELQQLETQCIQQYRQHAGTVERLARDAQTCQGVLLQLREMLLGFRADLGGLSGEIRQLQAQSRTLDVQLRNRRRAERLVMRTRRSSTSSCGETTISV